ncbi:hypothetical protein [Nocardia alba]|uniref:Uncharacterized protein n=1 Tax=Nocardia alba TaxID=225051 RepID=A0A4R1G313_9NOCA|nr:hypothetical protein [Nocardia alba]TCK00650.1 hypothetical protein DFR71_1656 [Nocardia alba]
MTVVHLRRAEPGLIVIAAEGAPLVTDAAPGLDVLVLEVAGGHLTWSLFDSEVVPAAVLDDVDAAQDWVWAIYGEDVASAVAANESRALRAAPARPERVTALRRLAYAHWASRWWPASTVDGIAALDPRLLHEEIESLTEQCEMMLDGDLDERFPVIEADQSRADADTGGDSTPIDPARRRAQDYALAAGGADAADGLVLARGSGGWDWRRCPPGILDAGANAVSWQVTRAAGISTVRVSVVAAPDCRGVVPEHLRPHAWVRPVGSPAHPGHQPSPDADAEFTALHLGADSWTGTVRIPGPPEMPTEIIIFVPGVGPTDPADESAVRDRIREFARLRLAEPNGDQRLRAEAAAAEMDEDF